MMHDEWLDDRADILAERLLNCGVTIEAPVARELVSNDIVATALERHHDAIRASDLATDSVQKARTDRLGRTETGEVVDASADSPRSSTAAVSFGLVGLAIAALSEAALSHLETIAPSARSRHLGDLLELMQILGELGAESPSPERLVVPAQLMWNVAARLDDAALRPDLSEELASVWRRDAMCLRAAASRSPRRRTR
jgi:hypothetical protein